MNFHREIGDEWIREWNTIVGPWISWKIDGIGGCSQSINPLFFINRASSSHCPCFCDTIAKDFAQLRKFDFIVEIERLEDDYNLSLSL